MSKWKILQVTVKIDGKLTGAPSGHGHLLVELRFHACIFYGVKVHKSSVWKKN